MVLDGECARAANRRLAPKRILGDDADLPPGFVAGPTNLLCSRARLDGYRTAVDSAGLPADDRLVVPGNFYHETGYSGGVRLLDLPDPPTAIFAASDQMALGVYEAVRQRGMRVADDVSVVGFDDLPEVRWASPPLTTVRQPLAEMGVMAARTLLRIGRGERIESPRVELATELVVRDSTAVPRRVAHRFAGASLKAEPA